MSRIDEHLLITAPLGAAHRFLDAFFAGHRNAHGEAVLTLRAGDMQRAAHVTIEPEHQPGDMTPHFAVSWKDALGGPYPAFAGTLGVDADEDYGAFWLVLRGTYTPPGGIGGAVFDALIGKRIADTTAHGLLDEIRIDMERRFALEEAEKVRAT